MTLIGKKLVLFWKELSQKKIFLKWWHIKEQKNSLNLMKGIEFLDNSYFTYLLIYEN